MAQSAVIVMAGATSMLLKGRGSLQDIDQLALMRVNFGLCTVPRALVCSIALTLRFVQSFVLLLCCDGVKPHTKWMVTIKSVSQIIPAIRK